MKELINIIEYIVKQWIIAVKSNTEETDYSLDYVAINSRTNEEYFRFIEIFNNIGKIIKSELTWETYILHNPIEILWFKLGLLKIRKVDPTRPQRWYPDFKVNYKKFKEKYIKSSNFALIIREDFEMIELKWIDVLVYFPNKTLGEEFWTDV